MTLTGRINDMDPDKLAALYNSGWTLRELARALGKAPGTIRYNLKKSQHYRPRQNTARRWLDDELAARREKVAELYEFGLSSYRIAEQIGVTQPTVLNDLDALCIRRRGPGRFQADSDRRERVAVLYRSGLTIRQVAVEVGATYSSVRRDLLALGVERRAASYRDPAIRRRRREQVVRWYKKGETISMVAFRLGMSPVTVGNDLKAMGVSRRRSSWHDD